MEADLIGKLRYKELDGRHSGNGIFKYYVCTLPPPTYQRFYPNTRLDFHMNKVFDFILLRNWCWDTWGPSCDFKDYVNIHYAKLDAKYAPNIINKLELNDHWTFSNDREKECRIYLKSDEDLAWLKIRWE